MKSAFFKVGVALVVATAAVNGVEYDVASCAELNDIDRSTVTSITITSSPIVCDSYTRFRVRNDMVIKSDSPVEFSNFALRVQGNLIVEPDVTFKDVTEQEVSGGVLNVRRGSSVTFLGTAYFIDNSSITTELPPIMVGNTGATRDDFIPRHGGAIFNRGDLLFEGDALFERNRARTQKDDNRGRGGAIYNSRSGTITFNGQLTVNDNFAQGFDDGEGGGIFNAGEVVVEGTSTFFDNSASNGGAIFLARRGAITFNDFSTFTENSCSDRRGGAIHNTGSVNLTAGSLFKNNIAASSDRGGDGGAIYNGQRGTLSLSGINTFTRNRAFTGGAILNDEGSSFSPPQDGGELIFEDNRADRCPDIFTSDADPTCSP